MKVVQNMKIVQMRIFAPALLLASLSTPAFAAYTGTPPLIVANGGTGETTLTAHGLLVGEGTGPIVSLTPAADSIALWQSSSTDPTVTPVNNCTGGSNALTYATATHTFGCNTISGGGPVASNILTGAGPFTLSSVYNTTNISRMGTPAAAAYNLPSAVTVGNGFKGCLKDDTTNFATNNATLKSPTAGTIDGIAGATGIVFNQARMEQCYISDGSNWFLE
jgi:hypothetical protein